MIKLTVYSAKGTKKPSIFLPKKLEQKANLILLAQAQRVYEDRSHFNVPSVKTRADVKISKRKIYRQKGTGYARHGAKSAPIFVGGGVAHGPKGIKRQLKFPQKMRQAALGVALSLKAKDESLIVVDGLDGIKKTKEAYELIGKITGSSKENKRPRVTFVLSEKNKNAATYLRNIRNVDIKYFENLNAYDVLSSTVFVDKEALETVTKKDKKGSSDKKTQPKSLPKKDTTHTKTNKKVAKTTKTKKKGK